MAGWRAAVEPVGHRAPSRLAALAKPRRDDCHRHRRRGRGRDRVGRRPGRLRFFLDRPYGRARAPSGPGCGGPCGIGRPGTARACRTPGAQRRAPDRRRHGTRATRRGPHTRPGNRGSFPSRALPDHRSVDDPPGRRRRHHVRCRGHGARDRGEGRERSHQHGPGGPAAPDPARSSPRLRLGDRPRDDDADHRCDASGFRGACRRAPGRGEDRRSTERGGSRSARRRRTRFLSSPAFEPATPATPGSDSGGGGGRDLIAEMRARGVAVLDDPAGFEAATRLPIAALFAVEPQQSEPRSPTSEAMARKAIELLAGSGRPFFLVVEDEEIDTAAHANDGARMSACPAPVRRRGGGRGSLRRARRRDAGAGSRRSRHRRTDHRCPFGGGEDRAPLGWPQAHRRARPALRLWPAIRGRSLRRDA